jgi:cell division protein FtsQ
MTDDLPVRGGRVRRRSVRRRASGGFSPRRALAALALLATAGLIWGVVASPVFALKAIEIDGAALTGEDAVRAALALPSPPPNTFTLATDALRARLLALPAVADAEVGVSLPGTVHVRLTERKPVLAWRRGDGLYLVDRDGRVVADAAAPGAAAAAVSAADGLPLVADRRASGIAPVVGGQIDSLDLDVATRLLSLTPADVGSTAPAVLVQVDEDDGWTISPTVSDPWLAVFGFYGPELRVPTMIPEQVRLLRSLLAGREARIQRMVLAGERQGTFTERPAP